MLKKIQVKQLKVGMFLHELCGAGWLHNPFWRSAFLIQTPKEIQQILDCGVQELWIDTSKGVDVDSPAAPPPQAAAPAPAPTPQPAKPERVSVEAEMARAAKICAAAKREVTLMFNEARLGRALNVSNAMPLVEEISQSVLRNPDALIGLARLKTKDDYTYMHSVAVCALMVALARQLGLEELQVREAGFAGLLHDIGKMMIPNEILNKPGALSREEFLVIQTHPVEGHKLLLEGQGATDAALDVVLHHHEKVDGTGYPDKLAGDKITLLARMGAVCDVYDALTSNRVYKNGWCPAEAIRRMAEWAGHFDDKVFQAFVKSTGIYPVGTLVMLESGRLGVVIEQSEKSLLTPRVKVFFSTKSKTYITPEIINMAGPGKVDKIVGREDAAKWGLKNVNEFWTGGR
ncbi:MAG: HD-GYP domain-containing protein [Burkholderiales bacterium]|nr:HD-GYP domain-containing protein [Burkholderiales bacterium]